MEPGSRWSGFPEQRRGSDPLSGWLRGARLEIAPAPGIVDSVARHLPRGMVTAVTSSAGRGLGPTLRAVEQLVGLGYRAVPHLAARMVRDGDHLAEVLDRLRAAGVEDVFVVAGDPPHAAGPYASALDLLRAMEELGHRFVDVGIAAYPEPHPLISGPVLAGALAEKSRHAGYAVSNLCFEAPAVAAWAHRLRAGGFRLPLCLGVAGPVQQARLLRIARRIGVGKSVRALVRDGMPSRERYQPAPLLEELARTLGAPELGVRGVQLSTFNDVATTERWRRGMVAALGPGGGTTGS